MRVGKAESGSKCRDNRMRRNAGVRRFLCFVLMLALLWGHFPMKAVEAAGETQQMANLVIFVKSKGDTDDVFNKTEAGKKYSNWQTIKQIYNFGTYPDDPNAYNNSFSNYISAVTEGKVQVTNYFLQETADGSGVYSLEPAETADNGGVYTLELPKSESEYSEDELVSEVLNKLQQLQQDGKIVINTSAYTLDNRESGVLDNLTLIVQGHTINGKARAFQAWYGGGSSLGTLKVASYNAIPTSSLFDGQQGVVAHEFLHMFNLRDLYNKVDGSRLPVGVWDIMASTSRTPNYLLSYQRAQLGWVDMRTITQSGTYTLTAVSESGSGDKVFALQTPLSDSEIICLEYRKKQTGLSQFDHFLPSGGLLMYRVDTKVERTNSEGDNYIYVYRPGVTDPEAATDTANGYNLVLQAALDVTAGETEYGSTDLSADFRQNTLYYSDGSNSGIYISDLKLSGDGNELTFTIMFADYTDSSLWSKLGDKVGGNCIMKPVIYADPATGALYVAYGESSGSSSYYNATLRVKRWNGTAWEQVGSAINNANEPALAVCNGELYLSYIKGNNGNPVYCKLNGSSWSQVGTYGTAYPASMQFLVEGNEIYGAYQEQNGLTCKLVIRNLKTDAVVSDSLSTKSFNNPALVKSGNYIYMVNADFSSGNAQIRALDISSGTWGTVHTISDHKGNSGTHQICVQDGKIYAFEKQWGCTPILTIYDGSSWKNIEVSGMGPTAGVSMDVIDGKVYLTYYDSSTHKGSVLCYTGTSFELYSDTLGAGYSDLWACSYGNKLYAVCVTENVADVVVREKEVTLSGTTPPVTPDPPTPPIVTPDPPNPPVTQEPLKVTLTPPAGYTDNHIHIDGVEYEAAVQNGSYSVKLPNASGKTAVMYCYDEKNIPVGMYVWKLSWQGEVCTAIEMHGLKDILSYHGFSIRVQSPAGIRFKSGIDTGLKQRLIAGNVEGCRLIEYGTLFITSENRQNYPFVKGGTKVGGGRAYWTENGATNDKVFETVAGRNRFTSVLINLAPNMYAKEIAFRAYVILECDGQELCIYGPPVSRSVYTVAKQVQARGEFKAGSSGYQYVQGIINSVEGR